MSDTVRELEARKIRAVSARATVPLLMLPGWSLVGSGVVLKCGERFFALTAGHVVGAFSEARAQIVIGPFLGRLRTLPEIAPGRAIGVLEPVDAGVVELIPLNRSEATRLRSHAVPCDDLILVEPHCDALDTASGTIVGCPGERYALRSDGVLSIGMFAYQTYFECASTENHLILAINDDDAFDLDTGQAADIPNLLGASGGGVWVVAEEPRSRTCLVATHVGSEKERSETRRYATAAPLRTHLEILRDVFGVADEDLAGVRRHRDAARLAPQGC